MIDKLNAGEASVCGKGIVAMRRMRWLIYGWPGLRSMVIEGQWRGLALAVTAAVLLNVALLATFVWVEWLGRDVRLALWGAVAAIWCVSALFSRTRSSRPASPRAAADARLAFEEALEHYLKRDLFEAERALTSLLRRNPRDVEARLMLATLLRHSRRWEEAEGQLDALDRLEAADAWHWERKRERERLAADRSAQLDNETKVVDETLSSSAEAAPATNDVPQTGPALEISDAAESETALHAESSAAPEETIETENRHAA